MKIEAWLRSTWAIGAIVIFAAFLLSTRSVGEEASSGGNTGLDSAVAPKESPSPGDDAGLSALTTARPVPLLPLPQEGSGRGAERRLEYLQEDFGTVSKDLGNGAVSTTPVSPKLKQSIQKRGAVHPPEDVATALQGSIDPAGSKVKSERLIFGSDDRVQITDTAPYPFRAVGQLAIRSGGSLKAWCSATLIAPRFVLTAAHCLYDPETRLWVE